MKTSTLNLKIYFQVGTNGVEMKLTLKRSLIVSLEFTIPDLSKAMDIRKS